VVQTKLVRILRSNSYILLLNTEKMINRGN